MVSTRSSTEREVEALNASPDRPRSSGKHDGVFGAILLAALAAVLRLVGLFERIVGHIRAVGQTLPT